MRNRTGKSIAKKEKPTLLDRFEGAEGKRRRLDAVASQQIVANNAAVAKALAAIASLQLIEAAPPNNVCIEQDAPDNDLYLILAGRVSICVHGQEVAIRQAGQHVGEMAMIDPAHRRCATVTAIEHTVVAKIPEAEFTPIANRYPELWRAMAKELGNRLRERNKLVKIPNPRPVIFIGSSAEARYVAQEISDGLSSENVLPKVWTNDLFRPSKTSIENLEKELAAADFAVMVVTPDDIVVSRRKKKEAPRDNVIWEHGFFLGGLGRERVFIVKPRKLDLKLPSDLLGVTALEYDPNGTDDDLRARLGSAVNGIRKEVKTLGVKRK
jgi:CRP/FNR family transcriptional regulator, cyclic AMP receptor protein